MAPPAQQHVPTADGALAAASSALATVEKAVAEPEAVRVTEAHYEPPPTFAMPDDDEHLGYHEEAAHSAHYPFESEYDAQRYIFCSRAYMFDAGSRYPPRPKAKLAGQEDPAELQLELPAAMPPRFRDAAAYRHARGDEQGPGRLAAAPLGRAAGRRRRRPVGHAHRHRPHAGAVPGTQRLALPAARLEAAARERGAPREGRARWGDAGVRADARGAVEYVRARVCE